MKKIIFVDDEPGILDGLRRMLRPHRTEWEMEFAPGAEAALTILENGGFEVIVSDMRMPGMDGAALLEVVRERYPSMLRIILSGYTDLQASLRAVPVAHQFLLKPCDPDALRAGILRSTALEAMLDSRMLSNLVGAMRDLPAAPSQFAEMREALGKGDVKAEELAAIAEKDVAIAAKILQLVNSAFFGVANEVNDLAAAVRCLGMSTIQDLFGKAEAFREYSPMEEVPKGFLEELNEHSLLTARIAREIGKMEGVKEGVESAALLHDVGKLVILEGTPAHFERVLSQSEDEHLPMQEVEQKLAGFTHAEVGGYLLSLWGLPPAMVEAVANHHCPRRTGRKEFDLTAVVYTANCLANEARATACGVGMRTAALDIAYMEEMGVCSHVPEFRRIAEKAALVLHGAAKSM